MAYDIVVAGVLSIFALVIHRINVELFNTESGLYEIAAEGTEVFGGAEKAAFMSDFLIIWLPLLIFGFAWVYAGVKIYRRQAVSARQPVR